MLLSLIKELLAVPELRGVDLDSPAIIPLRSDLIQHKGFLRRLYGDWYGRLALAAASAPDGPRIELGSGAGFINSLIPNVITSEVFYVPTVDVVFSAEALPFESQSLSALFLQNVFHHITHPARFLEEAARCLRPDGRVLMIKPYNTKWGRAVWRRLHHEAFEPEAKWDLSGIGPLSSANGALPWIVFERDRALFQRICPNLQITTIRPFMPSAYLVSGGVSMRSLMPGFAYPLWRRVEALLDRHGMFAEIHLRRI